MKRPAKDMTNEELARDVFPKKVVDELNRIAHEDNDGRHKTSL